MTKTPYRVTAADYDLLKIAKMQQTELYKEQVKYQRERSIKLTNVRIGQKKREILFKEEQLKTNDLKEYHEGFVDKKKPGFLLKNDIEQLKIDIEDLEDQLKKLEEEQAKNV